jgi:hypothetical protein
MVSATYQVLIFAASTAATASIHALHSAKSAKALCLFKYVVNVNAVSNVDALRTAIVATSVKATNSVISTVLNMSTASLVFRTVDLLTGCLLK